MAAAQSLDRAVLVTMTGRNPQSPFRLETPIPRSALRCQYPVPPRGAILSSCLLQILRVPQQGLDTGLGVRISHHAHACWQDS
jgi:hypothetical protein